MCFQVAYESSNMIKCFLRVTTKCIRETSVPFLENQPQVLWGIYNETCRWWYVEPLYPPREEGRGPAMVLRLGVRVSPEITVCFISRLTLLLLPFYFTVSFTIWEFHACLDTWSHSPLICFLKFLSSQAYAPSTSCLPLHHSFIC